jgi:selenide,water dikinase
MAGHLFEMAAGSGTTMVLELSRLPLFQGVETLVQKGHRTRASRTNREYVESSLQIEGKVDPVRLEVFYDAQTSGGLLLSIEASKADSLVAAAKRLGAARACIIGEVVSRPRPDLAIVLRP